MLRFSRKKRQWSSIRTPRTGLISAISCSNTERALHALSNLVDRISLRLVTERGEGFERVGNGPRFNQTIDVPAGARGRVAV